MSKKSQTLGYFDLTDPPEEDSVSEIHEELTEFFLEMIQVSGTPLYPEDIADYCITCRKKFCEIADRLKEK